MFEEQKTNKLNDYAYLASRALIWAIVIVLSVYIAVSEIRTLEKIHLYLFDLVNSN
jgi:hypothetical protein